MKWQFANTIAVGLIVLSAMPAWAQVSQNVPEYSGPTARFDRELENYREQGNALRASRARIDAVQRDRRNDLAVDRYNAQRSERVQSEMQRQRTDSLRANQRAVLRTNE